MIDLCVRTLCYVLVTTVFTFTGSVVAQGSSEIYYVRPQFSTASNVNCPNPCHTLAEYQALSQDGSLVNIGTVHLTMMFLPGKHVLTEENELHISGLSSFRMTKAENTHGSVIINMQQRITLQSVSDILFFGLTFTTYDVYQGNRGFLILPNAFETLTFHTCSIVHFAAQFLELHRRTRGSLVIQSCTIANNTLPSQSLQDRNRGSLLNIEQATSFLFDSNLVTRNNVTQSILLYSATKNTTIRNCTFSANSGDDCFLPIINTEDRVIVEGSNIFTLNEHIVWFLTSSFVSFYNYVEFSSNFACGGPLTASHDTRIVIHGDVVFINNTALNSGGAMIFSPSSDMELSEGSSLQLLENKAQEHGGAIFVDDRRDCLDDGTVHCFLEISDSVGHNYTLTFKNNIANISGDDVYGGDIGECVTNQQRPQQVLANSIRLHSTPTSSSISSDPLQLCHCNESGIICCPSEGLDIDSNMFEKCASVNNAGTIYRGQNVTLHVVAVGQFYGTTSAIVRAFNGNILQQSGFSAEVAGIIDSIDSLCTALNYRPPYPVNMSSIVSLFPDGVCSVEDSLIFQVNVSNTCPPAFQISSESGVCECEGRLQYSGVTCDINDQIIQHNGNVWVGYYNNSDLIIHSSPCPFEYCITRTSVRFTLNETDLQCDHNRSGLLCGQCTEGLSVLLGGSPVCGECSNDYLSLILPFAFAGIALLLLLFLLRLTVNHGTLSGLIFYANIVQVNKTLFLPNKNDNFLTIFIAWLNLDLGIVTCFYNGMDAYSKTWLQFVFPFYIWALSGLIMFSSSRSRRVTKLLGSNPVAVLSTLFLLSYLKVFRIIIAAISSTTLEYPNGDRIVWQLDGNVQFATGKHLPLLIFTLLVFLILFAPYTIVLLFGQWFQAFSDHKVLSWAKNLKLKAFLDTYHAPYKGKHRYWPGLLLCFRIVLAAVNALTQLYDTSNDSQLQSFANLLTVQVVVFICLGWGWLTRGVYNKWILQGLEASFLINLGLFSFTSYYSKEKDITGYVSIAVAFVTFLVILLYHLSNVINLRHWFFSHKESSSAVELPDVSVSIQTENYFSRFRESLLEERAYD